MNKVSFELLKVIVEAARKLTEHPIAGMVVDNEMGIRTWAVAFGKYGFVIHYFQNPSIVTIVRIYT